MIIAIEPEQAFKDAIYIPGGLEKDTMHITLFYFDDYMMTPEIVRKTMAALDARTENVQAFTFRSRFFGSFTNVRRAWSPERGGYTPETPTDVFFAQIESPELFQLRASLADVFDLNFIPYSKAFPNFQPHISVCYVPSGEKPVKTLKEPLESYVQKVEIWNDHETVHTSHLKTD